LTKRVAFYRQVAALAEIVHVTTEVSDSPDPKDNKFLALALDGHANFIVTGDRDLLALCNDRNGRFIQSWRDIQILSPASFMATTR
jgi:predicted nucleic acid-binding protein